MARFLRAAVAAGAADGYVARHRTPWWRVRLAEPPPILASYMARRPPAFVRNLAGARFLNIAHGLYPREPPLPRLLDRRCSPEQASGRLKIIHPDDRAMHVSHETIYRSIYLYPRGELRCELQGVPRSGRDVRQGPGPPRGPRAASWARSSSGAPARDGAPPGPRPPRGDLAMGTTASNSAVGTIVERMTGYLTLLPAARRSRSRRRRRRGHQSDDRPARLVRPLPDLGQRPRNGQAFSSCADS